MGILKINGWPDDLRKKVKVQAALTDKTQRQLIIDAVAKEVDKPAKKGK